jgi:hypothetical protein
VDLFEVYIFLLPFTKNLQINVDENIQREAVAGFRVRDRNEHAADDTEGLVSEIWTLCRINSQVLSNVLIRGVKWRARPRVICHCIFKNALSDYPGGTPK